MQDILVISSTGNISIAPKSVIITASVILLIAVALYLLRSFAIYKLSKKQKYEKAYLSFIPVFWVLPACAVAKIKIALGRRTKNFGTALFIVLLISTLLSLTINIISYLPIAGYFLQGGKLIISSSEDMVKMYSEYQEYRLLSGVYVFDFINPYANMAWLENLLFVLGLFADLASLIELVMFISFYTSFFRRYCPRNVFGFAFFSIFGLFGLMAFIVRNNKPVNYEEYMRSRYYGTGVNQNVNGGNTDANQGNYGERNKDPFGYDDIKNAKQDEDPFPEFNDKDKR